MMAYGRAGGVPAVVNGELSACDSTAMHATNSAGKHDVRIVLVIVLVISFELVLTSNSGSVGEPGCWCCSCCCLAPCLRRT